MPKKQVAGRTVPALQPVRGSITRLAPSGNPYLHHLPGPAAPRALDLFCGAGGLSLGFALAGFRIAGGIDSDAWAMQTHAYNFGGYDQPITLSEHLAPEDALQLVGFQGDLDVLIGGPPCQGFARVGRGKIRSLVRTRLSESDAANWSDPRNRLYLAYLRFVDLLRPKFLVMENVPDMARYSDGQVIQALLADLEGKGYQAQYFLLNAVDYGVPQTRQRMIVIANRLGLPVQPPVPSTAGNPVTLQEAIGDLPPVRPETSADELPYGATAGSAYARGMRDWLAADDAAVVHDHVVRHYAADDQEAFVYLPPGGRYVDLPAHLQRYRTDVFHDKYHKLYWDRPSWTITAHIAKDGYKYIHPDNAQARTLTVREAARIQSFPDWFRFAGYRTHRFRQIGNAVPPLLAKALATMVMGQLQGEEQRAAD